MIDCVDEAGFLSVRFCIFVIGTRAQLIKVAPVLRLASVSGLPHAVWLAGQHSDSMEELLTDFGLDSPLVRDGAARERSSIGGLLTWWPGAFRRCRRYIRETAVQQGERPLVVVHGDTLSTLLGALAARTARARLAHMESGLTSGHLFDPFPEELIRRMTFRLLDYALCPGSGASAHMSRYAARDVVDTGDNTLLDCVRFAAKRDGDHAAGAGYIVASIHRFENIYSRRTLDTIVRELVDIAEASPVIFVLHPPTLKRLSRFGLASVLESAPGLTLERRMPYTRFLSLLSGARGVISDGGSNQEELAYLGVPTVLYRQRSERPDGIGQNACFRGDIEGSLKTFVDTGGLDALRRPRRVDDDVQPSQRTLDALREWTQAA